MVGPNGAGKTTTVLGGILVVCTVLAARLFKWE